MMLFHTPVSHPAEAGINGLAVVSGAVAYYCITAGNALAGQFAVTPFRYTAAVFAMLSAHFIFAAKTA